LSTKQSKPVGIGVNSREIEVFLSFFFFYGNEILKNRKAFSFERLFPTSTPIIKKKKKKPKQTREKKEKQHT